MHSGRVNQVQAASDDLACRLRSHQSVAVLAPFRARAGQHYADTRMRPQPDLWTAYAGLARHAHCGRFYRYPAGDPRQLRAAGRHTPGSFLGGTALQGGKKVSWALPAAVAAVAQGDLLHAALAAAASVALLALLSTRCRARVWPVGRWAYGYYPAHLLLLVALAP